MHATRRAVVCAAVAVAVAARDDGGAARAADGRVDVVVVESAAFLRHDTAEGRQC